MQAMQRLSKLRFFPLLLVALTLLVGALVAPSSARAAPRCKEVLELHKKFSKERDKLIEALKSTNRVIATSTRGTQKKIARMQTQIEGYNQQLESKARQLASTLKLVYEGSEYGLTLKTLLALIRDTKAAPWRCPLDDLRVKIPAINVPEAAILAEFEDDFKHVYGEQPKVDGAPGQKFTRKQYDNLKRRYMLSIRKSITGLGTSLFDRCEAERTLDVLVQGLPTSARQRNKMQRLMDKQRKAITRLSTLLALISTKEDLLGARDLATRSCSGDSVRPLDSTDHTPPSVRPLSPAADSKVTTRLVLSVEASDNVGISKVSFYVDGELKPVGEDTLSPYQWVDTTAKIKPGTHTWYAVAEDLKGKSETSKVQTFTLAGADSADPACAITAPVDGATVSGDFAVSVQASDDVELTQVQLFVDGVAYGPLLTPDPKTTTTFNFTVKSLELSAGKHILHAEAKDVHKHVTKSAQINVVVENKDKLPPEFKSDDPKLPDPLKPADMATLRGFTKFSAKVTDNFAVRRVEFYFDGILKYSDLVGPYEYIPGSTTFKAGTSHKWKVIAFDSSENKAESAERSFTVAEETTVKITSPVLGATVASNPTVEFEVKNPGALTKLVLLINGEEQPKLISTALGGNKYKFDVDGLKDGAVSLRVRVADSDFNEALSDPLNVTVQATYVQINELAPRKDDGSVGSAFTVKASATAAKGVSKVVLLVNGTARGDFTALAAPFYKYEVSGLAEGTHSLKVQMTDAAGTVFDSAPVSVRVKSIAAEITSPKNGATLVGASFKVIVNVTADAGVKSVQLLVNGNPHGAADTAAPYEIDAIGITTGSQILAVRVTDNLDKTKDSDPIGVNIDARAKLDIAAPEVDFGEIPAATTADRSLTLVHSGGRPANFKALTGLGGAFAYKGGTYPGTGGTCGASISATCTIFLTFTPAAGGGAVGPDGVTRFEKAISVDYFDPVAEN